MADPSDEPQWLTTAEAAARFGVPKAAIRTRIRRGILRGGRDEYGKILVFETPIREVLSNSETLERAISATKSIFDEYTIKILPIIRQIQSKGVASMYGIAADLNNIGIRTARGCLWHNHTVKALLARAAKLDSSSSIDP